MNGKLIIKEMNMSQDQKYVWIKGVAETPVPDRNGELSGSDFFQFEMVTRVEVNDLDDATRIGQTVDIVRGEQYWQVVPNSGRQQIVLNSKPCKPNCPDCKAVRAH